MATNKKEQSEVKTTPINFMMPGIPSDDLDETGKLKPEAQAWHEQNNPNYGGYMGTPEAQDLAEAQVRARIAELETRLADENARLERIEQARVEAAKDSPTVATASAPAASTSAQTQAPTGGETVNKS